MTVALALQACAAPALGFDAKTCEDAGVGLASIATPVAKNSSKTRLPKTNPPGDEFPPSARTVGFVRTLRKFSERDWLLGLDSNQQPSG